MDKLAIDGGTPVRCTPFPARHLFGEAERAAVMALFDQAIATGEAFGYNGPEEEAYTSEFVAFMGGGHADLVSSGTAALFVALGALCLEPLSEVIVPPITDPGGVMPVPLLNCVPVVADAHPGSFNTGAAEIEAVLTERTRAIVVAHIAGEPADMDPIVALAQAHYLPLIEDCAQAHGARYKGRMTGTFGTLAAFSTMSGKHHATGAQGGIVLAQDEDLFWEAKRFADRGKPFHLSDTTNVRMGLNLNGNELAAAIGRVQLARLPAMIARRQQFVTRLIQELQDLQAVRLGWMPAGTEGAYWFLRLYLDLERVRVDKQTFVRALAAEGIPCSAEYRAVPSEARWFREQNTYGRSGYPWTAPEYQGPRHPVYPLPHCMAAVAQHFVIPLHEGYGPPEAHDITTALAKVEAASLR